MNGMSKSRLGENSTLKTVNRYHNHILVKFSLKGDEQYAKTRWKLSLKGDERYMYATTTTIRNFNRMPQLGENSA
jgi:hypothetical protein